MMLRTPAPKRPRLPSGDDRHNEPPSPISPPYPLEQNLAPFHGRHLLHRDGVAYDDGELIDCELMGSGDADGLRCAYRCRQMVKVELLETLDKQEKETLELSSQVQGLINSVDMAELEKKELITSVKRLEQEEAASSAREKALQEKFMLELEKAEERFRGQLKRCNDLEVKLQREVRQRAEAEIKVDAMQHEIASLKDSGAKAAEASTREISQLKETLLRVQKEAEFTISKTRRESSGERSHVQFLEAELLLLKAQIDDLQRELSESLDENRGLLQKLGNMSFQTSSSKNQELEAVVKTLRDELKSFEADVAEARRMKHFHMNASLLKEKLEIERHRADRAEAELGKLVEYQIEIKALEGELQSWRSVAYEIANVERPDDIPRKIASLQREAVSAMAKVGELTAEVAELQGALEMEKGRTLGLGEKSSCSEEMGEDMALKMKRLERKMQLVTKERDGLKAILSSYDEEEAIMMTKNKSGSVAQVLADTPQKAKEKRIQELEALVEDLQREGDLLRAELAKADMKLGRGDYDPSSTKVVRMIENLDVNAEKQVLLIEIQNLREKVDALQNKSARSGGAECSNTEMLSLKEQIDALEKRESRYKKIFCEKISIFRQACCLLFGYTVEMTEEQQPSTGMMVALFTLRSMYAQSEDEKMQFQFESNCMHMLANEYTSTPDIVRMVEVYLRRFNSIPAFTANLTSELFNKTTLG